MKQTRAKTLCMLLAALMLLSSLTACGKDKEKDSNLIQLGDYELLYKGACIMEDSDGKRRNRSDTGLHKQQQGKQPHISGVSMRRLCKTV